MNSEQRAAVVAEAMSWLKTPYHHQAAVKGAGVDCAMILVEVYWKCGLIPHIDPRPYPADWHFHRDTERYLGWLEKYADETDNPLPGDIATFQYGRCVSHAAIVVEWPIVIHAVKSHSQVIQSDVSTSEDMLDRLRKIYSLRG